MGSENKQSSCLILSLFVHSFVGLFVRPSVHMSTFTLKLCFKHFGMLISLCNPVSDSNHFGTCYLYSITFGVECICPRVLCGQGSTAVFVTSKFCVKPVSETPCQINYIFGVCYLNMLNSSTVDMEYLSPGWG